jgi:hypothetical protein
MTSNASKFSTSLSLLRDGGICPHPSRAFSDQTTKPATFTFLDYTSIASWRVTAYTFLRRAFQTAPLEVFADCLHPQLDAGNVLIDSTRFVTDENYRHIGHCLCHLRLRMAAQFFGAEYLLASARAVILSSKFHCWSPNPDLTHRWPSRHMTLHSQAMRGKSAFRSTPL